jgi:methionyl-tRNA formyltransferase
MASIMVTAGYDRSIYTVAVVEALRQRGMPPSMILVGYPFSATRIKALLRTRGPKAILRYALGRQASKSGFQSPMAEYAKFLGLANPSLRAWSKRWGVKCKFVHDLNAPSTVDLVKSIQPTVTLYTGGGILRGPFLDAARRRVINAHSGPLPAIRGMNACEWSLLLKEPLAVTLHLIDEGIDTGQQLRRCAVIPQQDDTVEHLRERCAVVGVEGLVRWALRGLPAHPAEPAGEGYRPSRQCFVMAPAIREILDARLPSLIEHQQKRRDLS